MPARQKSRSGKSAALPKTASLREVYEAADRSKFTGWFYLPQLTPSEQMTYLSRRAIAERADWLYKNVGAVAMVIDGLALDEVGAGIWPKWTTGQADYDKEMTNAFHYANHEPRVFSADQQHDYYAAQLCIRRMIYLYGDGFGQLLRPMPGRIMPSMSLLPGYIVENTGRPEHKEFIDGVETDSLGAPTRYLVLKGEKATEGEPVEAADLLHFHDPFLPGQRRGVSVLASVAKRMFSREDMRNAIEDGMISRELIGYAIETANGAAGAPRFIPPGAEKVEEKKDDEGNKYSVVKFNIRGQSRTVQVPQLEPGQTIRTIESAQPAPQKTEYLDSILRELAWAAKRPPEYVFFISGMGQGTAVRQVNWRVRNVTNAAREFQLRPQFLNRWDVFWAWQYIKSGRLAAPVPQNWWQHKLIYPADMSVDIAREGRLYDSRVSENKMSIETYFGMSGEDASDVEDENLAVVQRRLEKLAALNKKNGTTFTYFDLWPRTENAQLSVATVGGTTKPEEE